MDFTQCKIKCECYDTCQQGDLRNVGYVLGKYNWTIKNDDERCQEGQENELKETNTKLSWNSVKGFNTTEGVS